MYRPPPFTSAVLPTIWLSRTSIWPPSTKMAPPYRALFFENRVGPRTTTVAPLVTDTAPEGYRLGFGLGAALKVCM